MPTRQIRRPVARIDMRPQIALFDELPEPTVSAPSPAAPVGGRFLEHDPRDLFIGGSRLHDHLESVGVTDAFVIREVLGEFDWSVFEARYPGGGRAAYAPRAMVGIVMYGALRGASSLRDLERLARMDLGCMWVSGCIKPDHSILGRFLQRHAQELSGELFEAVAGEALRRTRSGKESLAGDGTTLEAMSSRFTVMKREAAQAWCEERRRADDAEAQEQAERVERALAERPDAKQIVVSEPDAALLKLKNRRGMRPGYEAAVTANEARVVVDAELHGSSELAAMQQMLDRLDATQTRELLLDAGFSQGFELIEHTVAKEISLLSPLQGQKRGGESEQRIALHEFHYDEAGDFYVCPEGERLYPRGRCNGSAPQAPRHRRPYTRYVARACGACARRPDCTRRAVRVIQRDDAQALKDALRVVMEQPRAKARFARRQSMVEPVFSYLRGVQRFERFRRRGLHGARLEFRLQMCAYNLSRIVVYARRAARKAFFALMRGLRNPWRAVSDVIRALWRRIASLRDCVARVASAALRSPRIA